MSSIAYCYSQFNMKLCILRLGLDIVTIMWLRAAHDILQLFYNYVADLINNRLGCHLDCYSTMLRFSVSMYVCTQIISLNVGIHIEQFYCSLHLCNVGFVQVMFEPYLKSFYIRSNDPTHVKLLKV